MKLILPAIILFLLGQNSLAQNYAVGVPVNDSILGGSVSVGPGCGSMENFTISLNPGDTNITNYVSGLQFVVKEGGNSYTLPHTITSIGTPVPFSLWIIGTPQVVGEEYPCNLVYAYTLGACNNAVMISSTIWAAGDTSKCYVGIVGIEEDVKYDLTIAPNPVTEKAIISLNNTTGYSDLIMDVYDVLGTKVKSLEFISSEDLIFDRAGLVNGIYFYRLINSDQIAATGKLVLK